MPGNDGKTIHEMILGQVQDNRRAIGALDLKLDAKIGDVHGRLNRGVETCTKRINTIEQKQAAQFVTNKGLAGRVRWLVWAVSAIGLTILGAVVGLTIGGGGL